ncbi:hypothetical protein [Sandaracinus amylolyticus]|uniref:hypothetical protein n=1 Tax=Sandaracinus amylolyticus TaxID=927083 RepID=UPI001F1CDE68|nr:hypothetical protein [Sandaracinus amylolyticus]
MASGCYASNDGTSGRGTSDHGTSDHGPALATVDLACAPSALDVAWVSVDAPLHFHPASLEVAPGDALLMRRSNFGSDVLRMGDGAFVASTDTPPTDGAWSRTIDVDPTTRAVHVHDVASGALVRTIEPGGSGGDAWWGETHAVLSDDGARALVLDCDHAHDARRTRLRGVEIASGATLDVDVPFPCSEFWPRRTELHAIEGGAVALLVAMRPSSAPLVDDGSVRAELVVRVDLARGEVRTVDAVGDAPRMVELDLGFDVLGAAISDDERVLAVTARDGLLRRFDTTTLAEIAGATEVGVHVANPFSYVPSVESPVAISHQGTWLAHMDAGGAIVVRDAASGAIAARLAMPFDATREDVAALGPPAAMALRFVDDGLLLATSIGVARFACDGVAREVARPSGALEVRASGPDVVRTGERARLRADLAGASSPVVRAVWVDGESAAAFGAIGPDVEVWMWAPGTRDLEIVVDDGVRTARDAMRLEVLPN